MKDKKVKIISVDNSDTDQSVDIESEILRLMNAGIKKRDIIERLGCDAKIYKRVRSRDSHRLWCKNNPEKVKKKQSKWYSKQKNSEKVKESNKRWREKNPDYGREWERDNSDKVRGYKRKYSEQERKDRRFKDLIKLKEGLENIKKEINL